MIRAQTPLSIPEAEAIYSKANPAKDIKGYFGKFTKLKASDAKKLRAELATLQK